MTPVEAFILELEGNQKQVMMYLHTILEGLNLRSQIRYRIPFYLGKSWICYLNPKKDDQVELALLRGNELSNSQGILDFNGRKQVAGITIARVEEIPFQKLQEVLQEAILLDDMVKYSGKKKKKKKKKKN